MNLIEDLLNIFIILWSVIDPIGTVPVFIATTRGYEEDEKKRIARISSVIAFLVLIFFIIAGEFLLRKMGVPLSAFQISGGVILFLFALNMIFGSSKPEEELRLVKNENETAIFPLAIPSIASPGAILAVVLLANDSRGSLKGLTFIIISLFLVLLVNYLLMKYASVIQKKIGNSGAIVISKIMGLILASIAANNILLGIKVFFSL
jgi:multiple antibiotic resistance protein